MRQVDRTARPCRPPSKSSQLGHARGRAIVVAANRSHSSASGRLVGVTVASTTVEVFSRPRACLISGKATTSAIGTSWKSPRVGLRGMVALDIDDATDAALKSDHRRWRRRYLHRMVCPDSHAMSSAATVPTAASRRCSTLSSSGRLSSVHQLRGRRPHGRM